MPLLVGLTRRKWHPRQESHLQPPRSKRGALIIELRERKFEGGPQKAEIPLSDDAQESSQLFFNLPFLPLNGADGETRTLVGQMRPAVYETAAVRKYLSLLSHIGEMVGRHGAAPCSAV